MSRWRVYTAICDRLSAGLLGTAPSPPVTDQPWESIIEASSHHLVTPALAWSMRNADCPPDVRAYFEAVLTLNRNRNQTIVATLARVVSTLNGAGIEPVLLKGAAHLADGIYPDPGVRIVGDVDLLVPAGSAPDALQSLLRSGFVAAAPTPLVSLPMHHLPRLCERETGVAVEVHTEVVRRRDEAFVPVPWFLEGAQAIAFRGVSMRIPDATRRVAHAIVHDQLQDGGYRHRAARLRPLLDLAMIRARHEFTIDWHLLQGRFDRNGAGDMFCSYLSYAEALFGQPMPAAVRRPPADAVAKMRQAIEQPEAARRAKLADLIDAYAARLLAKPHVVVNLLSPRTLAGQASHGQERPQAVEMVRPFGRTTGRGPKPRIRTTILLESPRPFAHMVRAIPPVSA